MNKYLNRQEAGKILAQKLIAYANRNDVIVLALPRGGVPVAFEIAKKLRVPLDVFVVRKIGVPGQKELAMGAMAPGGLCLFNDEIIHHFGVSKEEIQAVIAQEEAELNRREKAYRGHQPFPPLKNKTVILVDDGIATGASMRAAIKALRQHQPANIVIAVPVVDIHLMSDMKQIADDFICPLTPPQLDAVGAWYEDFSQTEDEEVRQLLKEGKPTE